jgi:hypothetical protein
LVHSAAFFSNAGRFDAKRPEASSLNGFSEKEGKDEVVEQLGTTNHYQNWRRGSEHSKELEQ